MSYMHILNTYKAKEIFLFKECFSLEKVHGSSAHIKYNSGNMIYYGGGVSQNRFQTLFNNEDLREKFKQLGHTEITVFGESYGGKICKMSTTYGKSINFVAFDIKIGDSWLKVPDAEDVTLKLNLEFVPYHRIPTTIEAMDAELAVPSEVAARRGFFDKRREGIILRPLIELTKNNGERIIAKHKNAEFRETASPRQVDAETLAVLTEADQIASEWVTEMRLQHILGKIPEYNVKDIPQIVKNMQEDIKREAEGEIVYTKEVARAIGKLTANKFKEIFKNG